MAQQQIIDHEGFVIHPSVAIDRSRVFTVMSPTRVKIITDDMPSGWTGYGVKRKHGQSAGRCDLYLFNPDGQKFRSNKEVQRFIESQNQVPVEEDKEQECSSSENDWYQNFKETPVTPAFPKMQKGYSSSHRSKTSRKKRKFHKKPSVSLPFENPNKRKRGRPRKVRLNGKAEVCSVAKGNAVGDILSGPPKVASRRKQLQPIKCVETPDTFSSDDSNGTKAPRIPSLSENKENLVYEGQTTSGSDPARLCSNSERRATVSKSAECFRSGSDGLFNEKLVLRSLDR